MVKISSAVRQPPAGGKPGRPCGLTQRQGEPRRGAAVAGGVERRERGGERLTRAVVARLDGRRPAQAGRRARAQARDVDAALEAERADTVDLSVDVAGLTVGARFAHAREAAPGDEAVGRRRPPAPDAVGRTVGPGCRAEYQDERESDRYAHLLRSLAEQFLAVNQARPNGASGAPNGRSGDLADVGRLQPLRALRDLELDPLPLIQGAKAGAGDRRVVNEDVFPIVGGDEPVTLLAVEPLHLALRHGLSLLSIASDCAG